jgi:hypothetical protein
MLRNIGAFLGIAQQVVAEKREKTRLTLAAQSQAEGDPLASRVSIQGGEHDGQSGLLRTWAGTDGQVSVLLSDGRTVQVKAEELVKLVTEPAKDFDALDEEHKQVALENGYQAALHTPTTEEAAKDILARFLRNPNPGVRAMGAQMLANREALKAAQVKDADFSHLAVFAAVKLRPMGPNQTEVTVGDKVIFFSYETAVGAILGPATLPIITEKKWSNTTSRHINKWLEHRGFGQEDIKRVPQKELDALGASVQAAAKNPDKNPREKAIRNRWAGKPCPACKTGTTDEKGNCPSCGAELDVALTDLFSDIGASKKLKAESEWVVNVGNVGNISCKDEAEARSTYQEYVSQSKGGKGRAAGEEVNLLHDGEPVETTPGDESLYAKQKLKAGISRLRSGRWQDTNGNSYATLEEAAEAEAHQHVAHDLDENSEEYKAQHEAALEEILSNVRAAFKRGTKVKAEDDSSNSALEILMEQVGGVDFGDGEGFSFYVGDKEQQVLFKTEGKNFKISFDALDGSDQRLTYPNTPAGAMAAAKVLIKELDPGYGVSGAQKLKAEDASSQQTAGKIEEFEVEDIGVEGSSYFQGRGTSHSRWDAVFVGIGMSFNEAVDDALEMAAMSGYDITPEIEKEARSEDPRADVDMVDEQLRDHLGLEEGEEIPEDADVSDELYYHVALYVKGQPSISASQRILVAAPEAKTKVSEATSKVLERLREERKKKAEPPKKEVPPYKGIQKSESRGGAPAGEEAHKIKEESPEKVKEGGAPASIKKYERRPEQIEEGKLEDLKDLPPEVAELAASIIELQEAVGLIEEKVTTSSSDIKKAEGYEEKKKRIPEDTAALDELMQSATEGVEAGKIGTAILALIRSGLKVTKHKFTEAEQKTIDAANEKLKEATTALTEATKKAKEAAEGEGRVEYKEERDLGVFPDPSKRKGEHAVGKTGTDVAEKVKEGAKVKSALEAAGVKDTLKKLWDKVSSLFKKAVPALEKVKEMLEKKAEEGGDEKEEKAPKEEKSEKKEKDVEASRRIRDELRARFQAKRSAALRALRTRPAAKA